MERLSYTGGFGIYVSRCLEDLAWPVDEQVQFISNIMFNWLYIYIYIYTKESM